MLLLFINVYGQNTGAKVYVEETTHNFGFIPTESTVTHSFYLHNYGTDSLKILKVKPG